MKPLNIHQLKGTILPHEPMRGGTLLIEIWEPAFQEVIHSPAADAPSVVGFDFRITSYPDRFRDGLAKGKHPAWIEWNQTSVEAGGKSDPVVKKVEKRLAFPEAYPDFGDSLQLFHWNGLSWDSRWPLFHLILNGGGHALQLASSPEESREKNPHFTHLAAWFLPSGVEAKLVARVESKTSDRPLQLTPPPWIENFRSENLGGKITVINFWATHCVPCLEEIPALNRVQAKFGNAPVRLVGLSTDKDKAKEQLLKFAARRFIKYPVGLASEALEQEFEVKAIPATFVLDASGKLQYSKVGEVSFEELSRQIESLLPAAAK